MAAAAAGAEAEAAVEAFTFPPLEVGVNNAPCGSHISTFTAPTSSVLYLRFHVTIADRKGTHDPRSG